MDEQQLKSVVDSMLQRYLSLVDRGAAIDRQLDGVELLVRQEREQVTGGTSAQPEGRIFHDTTSCMETALARFTGPAASAASPATTVRPVPVPKSDDRARAAAFSAMMRRTAGDSAVNGAPQKYTSPSVASTLAQNAGPNPPHREPRTSGSRTTSTSSSSSSATSDSSSSDEAAAPHIAFLIRQMHQHVPLATVAGPVVAAPTEAGGASGSAGSGDSGVTGPSEASTGAAAAEVINASSQSEVTIGNDRKASDHDADRVAETSAAVQVPATAEVAPAEAAVAVDWEAAARVAVASGEWKETVDAKKRTYYFHTKEKKSCWNLAKELERRALAGGS